MTTEVKKSRSYILSEIIDYVPNSMVRKTIVSKPTGIMSVLTMDTDKSLVEKNIAVRYFYLYY